METVVHMDRHGYRSSGFQYTNQTPLSPAQPWSPPHSAPTPGPSRRPLPTPRSRPESMPPLIQAPAPSRPAILAPSPALASLPTSPTAPPARRPLPTPSVRPAKHTSVDLTSPYARPVSPVKSAVSAINANSAMNPDLDRHIPTSFSRRTAPPPDAHNHPSFDRTQPSVHPFTTPPPTWARSQFVELRETRPSVQTAFVPMWKRNIAPVPPGQSASTIGERRSTVSGVFPIPAPPPRVDPARRAESPVRPQSAQQPQSSPPRRPLPSSPTRPPQSPSVHERAPASSGTDDDISSPSDLSSDSDRDEYEPMTFADPMQAEEDEQEHILSKKSRTPSPQYGIRDLPARSRVAIAARADDQDDKRTVQPVVQQQLPPRPRPVRSATLPQPPVSSPTSPHGPSQPIGLPQTPRAVGTPPVSGSFTPFSHRSSVSAGSTQPQSLTLRFAAMGLAEERERGKESQAHQVAMSPTRSESPTRVVRSPTSPVRQHQGWPNNIPPLPRTPGNTNQPSFGTSDISGLQNQFFKQSGTPSPAQAPLARTQTLPAQPLSSPPKPNAPFDRQSFVQPPERSPQQQFQPQPQPPSQLSERQRQKQRARDVDINLDDAPPPSLRRSPSPARPPRAPAIEITSDTPPKRQWTPGQDSSPRTGNADVNNSYGRPHVGSESPSKRAQPLPQPQLQPRPQAQPPTQRTEVPRISLPGGDDSDDNGFGPSIVVSGPANGPSISVSTPAAPAISISEVPSISVKEHDIPAISVSSSDVPSISFSPPQISVSNSSQPQRQGPTPGNFGSRHTQIQETAPPIGRGRGTKRGLPAPPSSWAPIRANGLSCGGCNGPIIGRIVSAMGQRWHPNCFKCSICNELLEHVSSYEHEGKPYCHLDYHEAFAPRCFHCKTAIIDERFITLDDPALGKRTYHEQHFFCAECGDPFLTPTGPLPPSTAGRTGELSVTGDGEFVDDDVGFTVYKGHPYCEACHVRLRMPKCKGCKKSIRDGVRAVEALGGKWCWGCFVCEGCKNPFEDPSFFLRNDKPFCEACFSLILRNEV